MANNFAKSIRPVALSALATMGEPERASTLHGLLAVVPNAADELARVEARLRAFEERQGMSSEELRRRVADGSHPMTSAVCDWLMLLTERDQLVASVAARSH